MLIRAISCYKNVNGNEHAQTSIGTETVGGLYREKGCVAEAGEKYRRSWIILERSLDPEHPRTSAIA